MDAVMSSGSKKRRSLNHILEVSGTGLIMLAGAARLTTWWYEVGKDVAPKVQEYVGTIGSGAVEYGLPGAALLVTSLATLKVIGMTDNYLVNKR